MKRFLFKVYSSSGDYLGLIKDVIDDPQFTSYINSGLGELIFRVPRTVFDFDEGYQISQNNKIKIFCYDKDALGGTNIYTGYISKYAATIEKDGSEFIDITCLGYISETERFIAEDASGNTTLTYNSYDPSDMLKDILDKFADSGGNLTYDFSSINDTSAVASYSFNTVTVKEALDKINQLAPYGWYFFIDSDNKVYFKKQNSETADHELVLAKDVISIKPEKSVENMVNKILFTGGDVSADVPFYKKYTRPASIEIYGLYTKKIIDGRVIDELTADLISNAELDKGEVPETRTTIVIRDNNTEDGRGYDIESIKPGHTLIIRGYGSKNRSLWDVALWDIDKWDYGIQTVLSTIQQIMKVSYTPNYITLEISSKLPNISKRVEDIKRNLDRVYTDRNPSAPME